ncbi:MAG: hypothetical protein ACHQ50_16865, partial [Fimbriimonadales bacterium]
FSPKNVLVYRNDLIILDHEVAHFGDPAFDIGFSMTHLLSKAHHLPEHRASFQRAALQFWTVYWQETCAEAWAPEFETRALRSLLACLLARAAGRSRLEYMNDSERQRQMDVVTALMGDPPTGMPDLISRFVSNL